MKLIGLSVLVASVLVSCSRETPSRCSDLEECCRSLAPGLASSCSLSVERAFEADSGSASAACDMALRGFQSSGICRTAAAGTDGGAGPSIPGGATPQTSTCMQYIDCVRDVAPSMAVSTTPVYGPDGACWKTEPAEVCSRACRESLERLHGIHRTSAACGLCRSNAECSGATPVCDLPSFECVRCTTDEHCGGSTPTCDRSTHTCVVATTQVDAGQTASCSLAPGGTTGTKSCPLLLVAAQSCMALPTQAEQCICLQGKFMAGTQEAQRYALSFYNCFNQSGCGANSQCVMQRCGTEWAACRAH